MKTYLLCLSTRCISTWFLKSSILKSKYSHKSILGFSQQRNSMGHAKCKKSSIYFLQRLHLFSFVRILKLMFWLFHRGVLSYDLSNHVYREIWICNVGIFFGFNPLCYLTWPSKIELVLILFWQWLHFLGFSPLCNFRWHPKMQKIFSIFLQQLHIFFFLRILALLFWLFHCGVLSDDLSNHV